MAARRGAAQEVGAELLGEIPPPREIGPHDMEVLRLRLPQRHGRIAHGEQAVAYAENVKGALSYSERRGVSFDVARGEFVAIVTKHETGGTVGTSGTIAHNITFDAYFE